MLLSSTVVGIRGNKKQVISLVATEKETSEDETSDWELSCLKYFLDR